MLFLRLNAVHTLHLRMHLEPGGRALQELCLFLSFFFLEMFFLWGSQCKAALFDPCASVTLTPR